MRPSSPADLAEWLATGESKGRPLELVLPTRLPWQQKLAAAVADPANRFITAVMGRRAGKTTGCSDLAGELCVRQDEREVAWVSPTFGLSEIGREKFLRMFGPAIEKNYASSDRRESHFANGSRVKFLSANNADSLIGRAYDLVIVDEAARVSDDALERALMPTIADRGGKIVGITTPKGRGNWIYEWHKRAERGSEKYATLRGPSTENPSPQVREFVEWARDNMTPEVFQQEILAEFIDGQGAVFSDILECARLAEWRQEPVPGTPYVVGCDLAKHKDYTVLVALDTSTGECHGFDRFNKLDWDTIESRVASFQRKWSGPVWIDSTGLGDPIYDRLMRRGVPCIPVKFTNTTKQNMVSIISAALQKREVLYPKDPVLVAELEGYGYEELPSGAFRYGAQLAPHDDTVVALGLALMGRGTSDLGEHGWLDLD